MCPGWCRGRSPEILSPPCSLHSRPFQENRLKGRFWHSLQSVVHGEPWLVEISQNQHLDNRTGQKNTRKRGGAKQVYTSLSGRTFPRTGRSGSLEVLGLKLSFHLTGAWGGLKSLFLLSSFFTQKILKSYLIFKL